MDVESSRFIVVNVGPREVLGQIFIDNGNFLGAHFYFNVVSFGLFEWVKNKRKQKGRRSSEW